jgi:hypothetical protein
MPNAEFMKETSLKKKISQSPFPIGVNMHCAEPDRMIGYFGRNLPPFLVEGFQTGKKG